MLLLALYQRRSPTGDLNCIWLMWLARLAILAERTVLPIVRTKQARKRQWFSSKAYKIKRSFVIRLSFHYDGLRFCSNRSFYHSWLNPLKVTSRRCRNCSFAFPSSPSPIHRSHLEQLIAFGQPVRLSATLEIVGVTNRNLRLALIVYLKMSIQIGYVNWISLWNMSIGYTVGVVY